MPRRSSSPPAVPAGRARAGRTSALDAGLRLLAVRGHSRHELRRKLGRRGYTDEDVEATVARLVELGYLDDTSFAVAHVRRRSTSRGPLALSAELAARGVDREVARQAVAGLPAEVELAAATRLAARQTGQKTPASYQELLDAVGVKLLRRGFSPAVARAACWAVWRGTAGELDAQAPQPSV